MADELYLWDSKVDGIKGLVDRGSGDINYRVCHGILLLKKGNEGYKDSTLRTYGRNLNRLYCEIYKAKLDMTLNEGVPLGLSDTTEVIKILELQGWTDRTTKNYYSLLLALLRGHPNYTEAYKAYRVNFEMIKKTLDDKQIKQEPKQNEKFLENLNMKELDSALNVYYKRIMKSKKTDLQASSFYMLGLLHVDQCLRNEACEMFISDTFLPIEDYPKTNFIHNAGRNSKTMIIRDNKVRNPDHEGYKGPKEVKVSKKLNSAINRHVETLHNNDLYKDGKAFPLVLKRLDKGGEHDPEWKCTSSVYAYLVKKIWKHKGWELTSTLIRKLYAIEVRQKYKGNLVKEKIACEKLDHCKDTHDKHYVIFFD